MASQALGFAQVGGLYICEMCGAPVCQRFVIVRGGEAGRHAERQRPPPSQGRFFDSHAGVGDSGQCGQQKEYQDGCLACLARNDSQGSDGCQHDCEIEKRHHLLHCESRAGVASALTSA